MPEIASAATPSVLDERAPDVDCLAAAQILKHHWGLAGTATLLRSERDRNFLVATNDGRRLVLKVSNSAEPDAVVDFENAAMSHMLRHQPVLPIPRLVATADGSLSAEVIAPDGRRHLTRLLTVVEGTAADDVELRDGFAADLGRVCALAARGLRGFDHPAGARYLEWDPRQLVRLAPKLPLVVDDVRRAQLTELLDRLADLPARTANLPTQIAHCDVTLSNVLTTDGRAVSGLIDFGDMHRTARVCDAAIALASLVRVSTAGWRSISQFLNGYQRISPLEPEELDVLGDLVVARLVATLLITSGRGLADDAQIATTASMQDGSWQALDLLTQDDSAFLTDRLRRIAGLRWSAYATDPDSALLKRRRELLGGELVPLFYTNPLHMARGEGPWLWSAEGVRYLDAYNNVPVIGHAHPSIAQSVGRQSATLNVNARYLHPNAVELAQRLLATMPDGLDTCIFMNSGSEANDLAWRMAALYTGRGGALVTDSSYHGVSAATAPLSANTWRAGVRPDHVAVFAPPVPADDGRIPGRDDAANAVATACDWLSQRSLKLALCLIDPMFTSGGIHDPDPEFVRKLVQSVHNAGALFLADEVQAGFGRSGSGLWSFSRFGITPDFVTLGKPMGNGHPIAALITRSDIARRFAAVDEYFSTFGGTPVSAAAALTVLDIIEQEELISNGALRGQQLRAAVAQCAAEVGYPVSVTGAGLIAGIDFGKGTETFTARLVERLVDEHVLVGSTGPQNRVLKVRPPLIWSEEHVGVFTDALRISLTELGR